MGMASTQSLRERRCTIVSALGGLALVFTVPLTLPTAWAGQGPSAVQTAGRTYPIHTDQGSRIRRGGLFTEQAPEDRLRYPPPKQDISAAPEERREEARLGKWLEPADLRPHLPAPCPRPPLSEPPRSLSPLPFPGAVAAWYSHHVILACLHLEKSLCDLSVSLSCLCGEREWRGREREIISAFTQLVVIRRQGPVLSSQLLQRAETAPE